MSPSLCTRCSHVKEVVSGSGSRFLLCQLTFTDPRFSKYPAQPVVDCAGFEQQTPQPKESSP
ncbi:MAG: hypothetical protein VB862_11910 [Pirellulaceae bacterium]